MERNLSTSKKLLRNLGFLVGILIIAAVVIVFIPEKAPENKNDDQLIAPSQLSVTEGLIAVESNPTVENYINLGLAYYNETEINKAIEVTQQAILIDPENKTAYNNLGAYYNKLYEWNKAIEALNKALEIDPNFDRALGNLQIATQEKSAR